MDPLINGSYGSYKIRMAPTRLLHGSHSVATYLRQHLTMACFMQRPSRCHTYKCTNATRITGDTTAFHSQAFRLLLNLCSRSFAHMAALGITRRRITGKRADPYGNNEIPPLQSSLHSAVLAEMAAAGGLTPLP